MFALILRTFYVIRFLYWCFLEYLGSLIFKPKTSLYLQGIFAPVEKEISATEVEVIGKIPADLKGQYIRNGPNPQHDRRNLPYHWFDGDGMLHAVQFQNSKAYYSNKWVRTKRWTEENKAGRVLYGGLGSFNTPLGTLKMILPIIWKGIKDPSSRGKRIVEDGGTANTALVYHDRRFMALVESSLPTQVRVPELETVRVINYDGKLKHAFTAHPKVDPVTKEMYFFGYNFGSAPFLYYSHVDKNGKLVSDFPIDKPLSTMIHDFAITENYAIFPDLPLTFRLERIFQGKQIIDFESLPSRFGILPRDAKDQSQIKWFQGPTGFYFHNLNAWEEGDEVVLIACKSAGLNFNTIGSQYTPYLTEFRFNMKHGSMSERVLLEYYGVEFPVCHPKLTGRKIRYGWFGILNTDAIEMNGVAKFDLETNSHWEIMYGENKIAGECVFIPREGATQEDDGYLITFVVDKKTNESECVLLDAKTMSSTPIARMKIPQKVPVGFHGAWLTEEQIKDQQV